MLKKIVAEVSPGLYLYTIWVLSSAIDVAFLVAWALIQYWFNRIIVGLELERVDAFVFLALQILAAVSTLAPIAFYTYLDIRKMWIKTMDELQKEKDSRNVAVVSNQHQKG